MTRHPVISEVIYHNPRPSTDVLARADEPVDMSTSPSHQPPSDLDPPANAIAEPVFDYSIVDYPQL